jgi:L-ascorbate metabolism protein UlaG (beta-lactamase superfamily)
MHTRRICPLLFVLLLAACAGPTATPTRQTIFTAVPATPTPVRRPSVTPSLTAVASAAPSVSSTASATPAAAVQNEAARLPELAGQAARAGDNFAPVDLSVVWQDDEAPPDGVAWTYTADPALEVQIEDGLAQVTAPDPTWSGPGRVVFQGCEAGGTCQELPMDFVQQQPEAVEVTFINNEGFVLAAAGEKIVVDGLFWGNQQVRLVPEAQTGRMRLAVSPFDDLSLILVSHDHYDHFDPQIVGENMLNNPQAVLLSTDQVVEHLARDFDRYAEIEARVMGVTLARDERRSLVINGVGIELFNFPHGIGAPHNLAFLITLGGQRLLHTGDLIPEETPRVLQSYQLADRSLEVAFVPYFWFTNREYRRFFLEGINARQIVPMHYTPLPDSAVTTSTAEFSQVVLFSEAYETLIFGEE